MNTALLNDAKLFEVSPLHVDESGRIGFLHEDKAAALGRLMAVDGQRDPIKVVAQPGSPEKPWRLVTGMHRLIGARLEGITVFAIEVSGDPEDLADLEASENLHRRPLAPIERAKFVHALVRAAQERVARQNGGVKQQKLAAEARWAKVRAGLSRAEEVLQGEVEDALCTQRTAYNWEESVGDAFGMKRRTIYNCLKLYRLLVEPFPSDLVEALSAHPVVGENEVQLRELAAIQDEAKRLGAIQMLIANPEMSADVARVQLAIDAAKTAPPTRDVKITNTISDSWTRLSLGAQRAYLPRFVGLLTDGQKHELAELIGSKPADQARAPDAAVLTPAVPIRASVKHDYIVCLEDGTRHTNLTKRLVQLGMTPGEYRARWSLACDYPMLAPNYSAKRCTVWRDRVKAARAVTKQAGQIDRARAELAE
jgi:ParB family chromosome partitioning protein